MLKVVLVIFGVASLATAQAAQVDLYPLAQDAWEMPAQLSCYAPTAGTDRQHYWDVKINATALDDKLAVEAQLYYRHYPLGQNGRHVDIPWSDLITDEADYKVVDNHLLIQSPIFSIDLIPAIPVFKEAGWLFDGGILINASDDAYQPTSILCQ